MLIRWTGPALNDLTNIGDHSEARFGCDRARRTALQIHTSVGMLANFPEMGRSGRRPGTMEQVIGGLPFLIIYRVKADVIEILRILHGAQRWP